MAAAPRESIGRDPSGFTFAAQVSCGADENDRRDALQAARTSCARSTACLAPTS
jgi:hypothetical protein